MTITTIALIAEVCRKSEFWYESFASTGSIAHITLAHIAAKIPTCLLFMPVFNQHEG
jgi:hypothetical protein